MTFPVKSLLLLATLIAGVAAADSVTTNIRGSHYPQYPTPDYDSGVADSATIQRGEYLVRSADCIACHTVESGQNPFSGGLAFVTPFGTIWSPNITPDTETGIGGWSDEDFIRAVKHGKSPTGKYYYPAFPYNYFALMSDDDVLAVRAYLSSIPPISASNRKPDMDFPFGWRFLQLGWRVLYFDDKPLQPEAGRSASWERGRYLVNGPGHCSMCHSPMNKFGAAEKKHFLAGAFIEGYYAPNITSSGLSGMTVEEIADVFKSGRLTGGRHVSGPMAQAVHDSFQGLTHDDQMAIAEYLKTVQSAPPPYEKSDGFIDLDAGKKIYQSRCIACHGTGALDSPKVGDAEQWRSLTGQGVSALSEVAIHGSGNMPERGGCGGCSDEQLREAVAYMLGQVED